MSKALFKWNNPKSVILSPGNSLQLHQHLLHLPSSSRDYLSSSTNSKLHPQPFCTLPVGNDTTFNFFLCNFGQGYLELYCNINTHRCLLRKLTGFIKPEAIFLRYLEQILSCNDSYISMNTPTHQFNLVAPVKLNQPPESANTLER